MNIKELSKGIGIILLYFICGYLITALVAATFSLFTSNFSDTLKSIIMLISELLISVIITTLYYKELKKDFQNFSQNITTHFKQNFKYYLRGLLAMYIANFIILIITHGVLATNETANRDALATYTLYAIPAITLIAPFCEEIVFRLGFKNAFKNQKAFILFTGILFGSAHLINSASLLNLLFAIPYCALGIAFSTIYAKSNNIFTSISFHILHNLFAVILILLA